MWVTTILSSPNKCLKNNSISLVSAGTLHSDINKLMTAHSWYGHYGGDCNIFDLISEFNNMNCFSMVVYPVVIYNDHFHDNVKSTEIKMVVCFVKLVKHV